MSFRLRNDARTWFKGIRASGALEMDFDSYYFCLMAGLATRTKADIPQSDTAEIVQSFPGEYKAKGRLIVALFLKVELEELGVSMEKKTPVHEAISRLVRPMSPSGLSDEGEREINKYAHGGFDVLTEWLEDRPRTLETFLPLYKRYLDNAISTVHQPE